MRVQFIPLGSSGEARPDETLLDVARRVAVPLGNSCGGIGICARCRVRVVTGDENLSGRTSVESRVSLERGLAPDERLACQAVVNGNCTVTTAYW